MADDTLIGVLKERVAALVADIQSSRASHAAEVLRLTTERDDALQAVAEVKGLITAIGEQALKGIERMQGVREPVVEVTTVNIGAPTAARFLLEQAPELMPAEPPPPRLMSAVTSLEISVAEENAIRPFIRRPNPPRDRMNDPYVLPASASHGAL